MHWPEIFSGWSFLLYPITSCSISFPILFSHPVHLSPPSPTEAQSSVFHGHLAGRRVKELPHWGAEMVPEMWVKYTFSWRAWKDWQLEAVRATLSSLSNSTQMMTLINFYFSSITIINEDCYCYCSGEQWERPEVLSNIYHQSCRNPLLDKNCHC